MPGKSKKHGKAKYSLQKAKGLNQPPADTGIASAQKMRTPAAAPASGTHAQEGRYPFIGAELRLIGILSGITLVILIVLALVLP
jgi:hypothetical protein